MIQAVIATLILVGLCMPASAADPADFEAAVAEMKPFDGPTEKGVDTTTLKGKIVTGYQGWFGTPNDGFNQSFKHYEQQGRFEPGSCTIDYWPHTADFPEDARVPTPFTKKDGSTAHVFSSTHPAVVMTHFKWMKDYGIQAAFLQRFGKPSVRSVRAFRHNNRVLENVRAAANAHGRAYIVMYDIGGLNQPGDMELLKRDWKLLVDKMGITRDPADKAYLHHRGKPLVALWGPGFRSRRMILPEVMEMVRFLKTDKDYGGCSVMLGVPSGFATLSGDCVDDPAMHKLMKEADVISPWAAGRMNSMGSVDAYTRRCTIPNMKWCADNNLDYLPCVFPGFSWANLKRTPKASDAIPRRGGRFYWKQIVKLIESKNDMIYVGMFDEIDEGTQICKVDNDPPPSSPGSTFLHYSPQPEDYYLWITGEAQKMLTHPENLRREMPLRDMPSRHGIN